MRPGPPRSAYNFECRDCRTTMATDNPVQELVEMWLSFHAGHDLIENHEE